MINILKRRAKDEGNEDSVGQLKVFDNIRREIVQSSRGVFNETRWQDIINSITKVFHLSFMHIKQFYHRNQSKSKVINMFTL